MSKLFPHHRGQMSEAFRTVMFLSASGGLQDAYTYIGRGKVFANAQTGNIVLMSQSLFDGGFIAVCPLFYPSFCPLHWVWPRRSASACAGGRPAASTGVSSSCWPRSVLLFAVGFFPAGWDIGANALVSLPAPCRCRRSAGAPLPVCQYHVHRQPAQRHGRAGRIRTPTIKTLWGSPCSSLPLSLSLRWVRASAHSASALFGERTSGFPCALLLVSLCFMFIKRGSAGDRGGAEKITHLPCWNGRRGRTYPPGNTVAAARPRRGQDPLPAISISHNSPITIIILIKRQPHPFFLRVGLSFYTFFVLFYFSNR